MSTAVQVLQSIDESVLVNVVPLAFTGYLLAEHIQLPWQLCHPHNETCNLYCSVMHSALSEVCIIGDMSPQP